MDRILEKQEGENVKVLMSCVWTIRPRGETWVRERPGKSRSSKGMGVVNASRAGKKCCWLYIYSAFHCNGHSYHHCTPSRCQVVDDKPFLESFDRLRGQFYLCLQLRNLTSANTCLAFSQSQGCPLQWITLLNSTISQLVWHPQTYADVLFSLS